MSALLAALHIFVFQFSLLFFHISVARQHQHCGVLSVYNNRIDSLFDQKRALRGRTPRACGGRRCRRAAAGKPFWLVGFNTQYRTSDVAENLGRYVACTERASPGKDLELILTVKMETRHPVEGQFGSEFSGDL